MKELFFNTIQEFYDFIGVKTLHPLVSIAAFSILTTCCGSIYIVTVESRYTFQRYVRRNIGDCCVAPSGTKTVIY